ncbi:ATP-binding cassette domain-containing protein [Ruminococcaceae bacterium AM07-15]|nr:ATP-binding cassette domain-containing protein [Ruminococcaceae bacterium AM07-15]
MIALEQVEKTYASGEGPVQALSGVSFTLGEGECWGIVGPSGAGKSTLLRLMALLEEPTRGRVVLDGVCFAQSSPREKRHARQQIATVFQDCRLLSRRTVAQNAALPLQMQRLPRQEIAQRGSGPVAGQPCFLCPGSYNQPSFDCPARQRSGGRTAILSLPWFIQPAFVRLPSAAAQYGCSVTLLDRGRGEGVE